MYELAITWQTLLELFNSNQAIPGVSYDQQPRTPLDRKKWLGERIAISLTLFGNVINQPNFNTFNINFPSQTNLAAVLNAVTLEDGKAIIEQLFSLKIELEESARRRFGYDNLSLFFYFIDDEEILALFTQLPLELSIKIIALWSAQSSFEKISEDIKKDIYHIMLNKIDDTVIAKLPEILAQLPFALCVEFTSSDKFKAIYHSLNGESRASVFNTLLNKADGEFEKNQINEIFLSLRPASVKNIL